VASRAIPLLIAVLLAACSARSPHDRDSLSKSIHERTGYGLKPVAGAALLPEGVDVADGLTEDEAVATALWNNAQFQADLTRLGFARADLIEAGMLRNPVFTLLLPLGPKQLEATLGWAMEPMWPRPRRVAIAKVDMERVAEDLVRSGLGVVHEARIAHAELVLAQEKVQLAQDARELRGRIAELTEARLAAGDISELEANLARADARQAEVQAADARLEATTAKQRLRFQLGLGESETDFTAVAPTSEWPDAGSLRELMKVALAARPDLRAAELGIEAAGKRGGVERARVFSFVGILDINGQGREGLEAGPGVQAEVPVFNWNNAGRARARAEMDRAARQYVAVRHRVFLEVQQAHARYGRAREGFRQWRERVLPPLAHAAEQTEKAYAAGEVSYLFVLEASRKVIEARFGVAEAAADVRRASADLDRSIGKRLNGTP
jgi:cobalt-zinc-cadmium efflux system outer membrane protein